MSPEGRDGSACRRASDAGRRAERRALASCRKLHVCRLTVLRLSGLGAAGLRLVLHSGSTARFEL
ncbi:hypothetical protein EYF80_012044 [Liparis tanakae]|uniref:Uncharacterized protein n=1 Tax=Liparis tanakae TaxID=230148 RepID=A0A4Z2IIJ0_9TELE|nr:hypothetical protein EYF80_012044 [Liparis tanakae]